MPASSKTTTLLIGGAGFIGRELALRLITEGRRNVVILGRSPRAFTGLLAEAKYIQGSLANSKLVSNLLDEVDEVVDLAYSTVPKTSFDDPLFDLTTNLPRAVNLLEMASRSNLKKYVLVSSGGAVYGEAQYLPINESHPTNPISPYGISKLVTEKYATFFNKLYGLPVIIARPGNPYGAAQVGNTVQGFVGYAIYSIRSNMPVKVFGSRGTVRDYIHIEDLAGGLMRILEHGNIGATYNIGTGIGYDNLALLEQLRVLAESDGYGVKVEHAPSRDFDVRKNVLDSGALFDDVNWSPKISLLDGLQSVWAQARL